MNRRRWNKWLSISFLAGAILLVMLLTTSPGNLPVLALLMPPLLLFMSLTSFLFGLQQVLRVKKSRRVRYAVLISAVPVILLLLQSIDQLTIKDVALMLVLAIISGFYISKLQLKSSSKM